LFAAINDNFFEEQSKMAMLAIAIIMLLKYLPELYLHYMISWCYQAMVVGKIVEQHADIESLLCLLVVASFNHFSRRNHYNTTFS
jgi:hypothetical protein